MFRFPLVLRLILLLAVLASFAGPVSAAKDTTFQTGFVRWPVIGSGFAGWTLSGVNGTPAGALQLDLAQATPGTDPYVAGAYYGGNFYNGGTYRVDEATSPEIQAPFAFTEAIASWNADTCEHLDRNAVSGSA